jgi:hypothetical protein
MVGYGLMSDRHQHPVTSYTQRKMNWMQKFKNNLELVIVMRKIF